MDHRVAALLRRPGDDALMPEMPRSGKHHGDSGVVGRLDDFIIAHLPARLDHGGGAGLNGD
jgi:hypothetical protein